MTRFLFLFLLAPLMFSCADKYKPFKSQYNFKSKDGTPDYSDLHYWAAHPWKRDPSDSIPARVRKEPVDSLADVFFLHPTTYTKVLKMKNHNASIDDDYINAKTDYSTILYQASVFNQQCRVFAPRYRQAHIKTFFEKESETTRRTFDVAYSDIKNAFEYYMEHWNNGRPIIIASHSQGSMLAERLLKEYFQDKPLQNKLVVAYIIGWQVPKEYFTTLKMCSDSLQTGCICSWRTFRRDYVPFYLKKEKGNSYVTNPLTWTTDSVYAPKELNKGSVLTKFNKVYNKMTDAQISNGLLYVKKPRLPFGFLYLSGNYHIADINLFYLNIRENVRQRIRAYNKK
jgi:Protein of unknown function (DUF3089)